MQLPEIISSKSVTSGIKNEHKFPQGQWSNNNGSMAKQIFLRSNLILLHSVLSNYIYKIKPKFDCIYLGQKSKVPNSQFTNLLTF